MERRTFLASLAASIIPIGQAHAQRAGSWDGSWTGLWQGNHVEVLVRGRSVQCILQGREEAISNVRVSPDTLSFTTRSSALVTLRRAGSDAAQGTYERGSTSTTASFTRAAPTPRGSTASWDGTWRIVFDNMRNPGQIVISGNKVVMYYVGSPQDLNPNPHSTAEVESSEVTKDRYLMNLANWQGRSVVTLYRKGPNTASYEFTVARAGIKWTGTVYRR